VRRFAIPTLFSIVLSTCTCALALDPELDLNQYAHTAWKLRDGFGKGPISSIAQTPDGYLWLGSEFGLLRFDGIRNVAWQPPGDQRLPPGRITRLLAARNGTLWIGGKGLASWNGAKLTQYSELADQYIFALLEDREGTVWVGSLGIPKGKLCAIRSAGIQCYGDVGGRGYGVVALYEDRKGDLWVGVRDGLWRWNPGPPKFYSLAGEPDGIQAFGEDADGTLLVGWKKGIYRFVDGQTEAYSQPGGAHQFRPSKVLRDRDGSLWIGTHDRGLFHVHQGRTDAFSPGDGLSGEDVFALFEDREGNVWTATNGGLDRFRDFAVATFTENQGLSKAVVGSIVADKDGGVWLATYGGLNHWDHGQVTIPRTGDTMRDGRINGENPVSLLQDDRGRIWVCTLREFGYLENGRFNSIKSVPGGNVLSIVQDAAGDLWMAYERLGLFRISPPAQVRQAPWAALGHKDYASILTPDHSPGGLWIGFFQGGIAYLADGKVRASYTTADGLGEGRVGGILFDHEGTLWASTEGGLSRLKNNRFTTLTSKNGLPCDTVHWAIEDDDHSLWLFTACGLVRIERSELEGWVAAVDKDKSTKQTIRVTVYGSSDGVPSAAEGGHYNPQVVKTSDGKLWFQQPSNGVSVIDPHHIPFNKLPPPVQIEEVIADDKAYDMASDVLLTSQTRHLEIDYTALSLAAPEKVLFRYKLENLDRDWRDAGTHRQAFYTNLAPGHYRFRVAACNNSGVWNEAGAFLDFSVAPAYYQTTWFRVSCATAFVLLLWGIYQLRVQHLQRQFAIGVKARVNERTRIARELHDTLLQSLHGLMFQFQAVRNLMPRKPEEAMQSLDEAISETEKALAESRDAIQGLRSEPIAKGNLAELLRSTSQELVASGSENEKPPVFDLIEEGERKPLSPASKNEICRIAFEILRNAFRHSHAHRIEAEIRYDAHMLRLRIRDDGQGIDPKVLKEGGKAGHWGLRGLRERAERIGARLDFWSEAGAGTEVQLAVPAAVAYETLPESAASKLFRTVRNRGQHS
jgi:ligand-binding sensor domain-containing protein/signal transduction histidine kinase